jgi:hypothetical protein
MNVRACGCLAWALLAVGCATKRLPPGTPPPEYETRTFAPWPPASASAAPDPAQASPPAVEGPPVSAAEAPDGGSAISRPSPDAGSE